MALARGTTIGGWEVQRTVAEWPWPEARAERADGTLARLTVLPAAAPPSTAQLVTWRAALAPSTLDHPAFPAVRGIGHDAGPGVVWIARVWSPWSTYATIASGHPPLAIGRRGAALCSLGAALTALHAAGAVHGGLAAARVLLSRADGSACEVLDLGLDVVAAGLGLTSTHAVRPPEGGASRPGDVHAFATIVDQVVDAAVRTGAPWRGALEAWLAHATAADPALRPTIAAATQALAALLPPPEPAEVVPPIPPPSPEELARIEAAQQARDAELRARIEGRAPGGRPRRRTTGPNEPAFLAPIVAGGPAIEPDVWPWMIRARRPMAVFTYESAAGTLVTGPVTWQLGAGQQLAAAAAIADAIARAVDALAGPRGPGELDAELAAAGFTAVVAWSQPARADLPRPRGTRWWQGRGLRALVTGATVTLQRERRSWVTSHQIGTVGEDLVMLATGDLPRAPAARRELLAAALAVIGLVDQRPTVTHLCRFCHGSFDALHFHASLGACHGCAELHLHVVH